MLKSYKEIIGEITRDSNCNNIILCVDHIGTSWGSVKYEVEDF